MSNSKNKPLPVTRKPYGGTEESEFERMALAVMQGRTDELDDEGRRMLDRTRDAYRIICGTPNKGKAVKELCALHPEISERTARNYINYGIRIWNPADRLDRDFLNTVFLNALIADIYDKGSSAEIRAKNLATLQRYLAAMPDTPADPMMMEKHNIYIQLNLNGSTINLTADKWDRLKADPAVTAAILDAEITETEAQDIMEG